jgi:hypothetical protein
MDLAKAANEDWEKQDGPKAYQYMSDTLGKALGR